MVLEDAQMLFISPSARAAASAGPDAAVAGATFELRFDSLFVEGRGLSFPCDAQGRVQIDALSERARDNYLYARAVVGREFRTPAVRSRNLG
jgi:hypothetical protein